MPLPLTIRPEFEYPLSTIRQRNYGRGHRYIVEGISGTMPSVTTELGAIIAKPYLAPWARKDERTKVRDVVEDMIKQSGLSLTLSSIDNFDIEGMMAAKKGTDEEASDAGTAAHKAIEDSLINGTDPVGPEAKFAHQFIGDEHLTPLRVEMMLYHPAMKFAGTVDLIARDADGGLVIADWKRSKGLYWEYALQIAGYALALEELTDEQVLSCYAVKLPRSNNDQGEVERVWGKKLAKHQMAFIAGHEFYSMSREVEKNAWGG